MTLKKMIVRRLGTPSSPDERQIDEGWVEREVVGEELAMYERHAREIEEFAKRREMSQRSV